MNAREIAKQKANEKRETEKRNRQIERDRLLAIQKRGDELGQLVDGVVNQFSEDFIIEQSVDKVWKLTGAKPSQNIKLFVILRYDTHPWRGSDESPEEPFNQWVVDVEVVDYKYGKYNPLIGIDTKKDAYFCYLESNFERQFGEYMAKYYV